MKRFVVAMSLLSLCLIAVYFVTNSDSEQDTACLVSKTIRVEIGGERFAFPRKLIKGMKGEGVINIKGESSKGSASGSSACQKLEDPIWNLNSL